MMVLTALYSLLSSIIKEGERKGRSPTKGLINEQSKNQLISRCLVDLF